MGVTIGVTGASGGLGASTLVATLAMRAHAVLQSCRVRVGVDLDPRGGLETTMCLEHLGGMRWPDIEDAAWSPPVPAGPVRVASLPGADDVHVLSGAGTRPPEWRLVDDVLETVGAAADVVVVDCGPRPPVHLLARVDLIVVLARTTARGAADLAALLDSAPLGRTTPVLVTRAPGRDRHGAALGAELRLPFLAHLPDDSAVLRHEREGVPPGVLRCAVDTIADEVLAFARPAPPPAVPRVVATGLGRARA
ncbi:hypothetical protein GA707_03305 [Nostocoides sp. F2B08]|uniref:hypothetical protein n=1 Tax=Nostocoides sp. F2B08 TaxID=2653936 RepID=UPI001263D33C|nr:hypothetical protein [Tetrasphaera sp. F2B08]KAB7746529.1 hypothetical protein GA707_03305 [Tetrasphaera sp. F2B08]